jgi:hypothetical protein
MRFPFQHPLVPWTTSALILVVVPAARAEWLPLANQICNYSSNYAVMKILAHIQDYSRGLAAWQVQASPLAAWTRLCRMPQSPAFWLA